MSASPATMRAADPIVAPADVEALIEARHSDPFAVLGAHRRADGRRTIRAFLPGAQSVRVLPADAPAFALDRVHVDGMFAADDPSGDGLGLYELEVWDAEGRMARFCDPYQFGLVLDAETIFALKGGRCWRAYRVLGARTAVTAGVEGAVFVVWAPNAGRVSVVGDFNHWDPRRHPMRYRHDAGVWEIFLPGVGLGAAYAFDVAPKNRLNAGVRRPDPYAFALDPYWLGVARLRGEPVAGESAVGLRPLVDPPTGFAGADPFAPGRVDVCVDVSVPGAAQALMLAAPDAAAAQLAAFGADLAFLPEPYARTAQGVKAMFADPQAGEGVAEAAEALQRFGVRACLDWRPYPIAPDAGLSVYDGSRLYEQAPGPDGGSLRFDGARYEVANYLVANALYWLDRFGDAAIRVRGAPAWLRGAVEGGLDPDAGDVLRRIGECLERGGAQSLLLDADTPWPFAGAPTRAGGLSAAGVESERAARTVARAIADAGSSQAAARALAAAFEPGEPNPVRRFDADALSGLSVEQHALAILLAALSPGAIALPADWVMGEGEARLGAPVRAAFAARRRAGGWMGWRLSVHPPCDPGAGPIAVLHAVKGVQAFVSLVNLGPVGSRVDAPAPTGGLYRPLIASSASDGSAVVRVAEPQPKLRDVLAPALSAVMFERIGG
ncbi:MAG: hypothetical protein ACFB2Z_07050 [Maricaulaceae bacterium]